jgi:hypothetical protein
MTPPTAAKMIAIIFAVHAFRACSIARFAFLGSVA